MKAYNILLLSAYPPGIYQYEIEKAFVRMGHRVFTAGNKSDVLPELEAALQRYDPGYHYNLVVPPDEPLDAILAKCPFRPDFILYMESGFPFLPQGLVDADCSILGVLSEDILHADWYSALFPYFDLALCARKSTEENWRAQGFDNVQRWYFGARPTFCVDEGLERIYDVAFLGNLNPRVQRRRLPTIQKILRLRDEGFNIHIGQSVFFQDYNRIHCQSKIVYHGGITDQVNMRVFEAMGAGCLVIMRRPSDENDSTSYFFRDREEVVYCDGDEDALALIRYYTRHEDERKRISAAGHRKVMAEHNYTDVVRHLLDEVLPCVPEGFREARRQRLERFGKDVRRQRLDHAWYYLTFGALEACHNQVRAIQNFADDSEALNLFGVLFATAGQSDQAVQCLTRACARNPHAVLPRVNLVSAGIAFERPEIDRWCDDALSVLEETDPRASPSAAFEGPYYPAGYDRFRSEMAHAYFRYPAGPERNAALARLYRYRLHHLMGHLKVEQGMFGGSLSHIERALTVIPDDGYLLYDRAHAYAGLGEPQKVVEDLRRATELEPFFTQAQHDLAISLEHLGRFGEAFDQFWRLARHNPLANPSAELWQRIGELALRLGKQAEALEAFEKALSLKPDDALRRRVAELRDTCRASIMMALDDDPHLAQRALMSVKQNTEPADAYELVLISRSSSPKLNAFLSLLEGPLKVVSSSPSLAADYNRAAEQARGNHLVFLDQRLAMQPGWLKPLLASASGARTISVPLVCDESRSPQLTQEACFCLSADLWRELGGLEAGMPLSQAVADLRRRLEQQGGSVRTVSESIAVARSRQAPPRVPKASIIILAWNQLEYTRQCVASVLQWTRQPYELILVDNGSTDGTLEYFRSVAGAKVVANGANLGFAAGNNRGIQAATGDYLVLLNNDTIVTPGWLEGLIACAEEDPAIGIVGPMSNYVSGPQQVSDASYQTLSSLWEYARQFLERHRGRRMGVDRIVGFCMLITRELVTRIGVLDERFGIGNFEDDDYCLRAKQAGFRLVASGDVFIHHFGSRTFLGQGIDYAAAMKRGREAFMEKWNGKPGGNGHGISPAESLEAGRQRFTEGKLQEATAALKVALHGDPSNAAIWNDLACSHAATGDLREAERCFRKAEILSDGEDGVTASRNLGALYFQQGRWLDAIASYEASITKTFDLDTLVALSDCYLHMGAAESSILGFQKALELAPDHSHAKAGLAAAERLAGRAARPGLQEETLTTPLDPMGRSEKGAETQETTRIQDDFHRLWYDTGVWRRLAWFGIPIRKNPLDCFQYQEILWEQRPDYVIECGAFLGGSTLYFAHLLDLLGHGTVISIELGLEGIWNSAVLDHPRVIPIPGSSVSPEVLHKVRALIPSGSSCFVILDSDHRAEHVLAELRAFQEFPQIGNYLIVEDTNINGHPVLPGWGPGPWEAVEIFLRENPRFAPDRTREQKMRLTFAPSGWLKRVS